MADQWTCSVEGCFKKAKARGLCRYHYDRDRMARLREASQGLPPTWSPPAELSLAWQQAQAAAIQRTSPTSRKSRPCGLTACGGTAMRGSDLCAAHDHWRAAQRKLAARGLA